MKDDDFLKNSIKIIFIVIVLCFSIAYSANNAFYNLIEDFEIKLDEAAISWIEGKHGRALDTFRESREMLAHSVFASTEGFEWEACQSLQTYTLVLSRMTEAEMYKQNGQDELGNQINRQAMDWADKLVKHGTEWRKIHSADARENNFRIKWLQRYKLAILKARKFEKK